MSDYRYYKGGEKCDEAVEFDLINTRNKQYETTCVVSVRRMLDGFRTHPCGDGRDLKLDDKTAMLVLEAIKAGRDAIKFSGKPKSLAGWYGSGLNLDEYLAVGDEVDEDLVNEQMNCVPPHVMKAGYLQVGEPYADALDERSEPERYRPVYATLAMDGLRWLYMGHCFTGDTVNRIPERDVAGGMLRELRIKLGGGGVDA